MELNSSRHGSIIAVGRLIQTAIALISVRILTSLLSPTQMGRYWLIISITASFALILVNPVGMYINRRLVEWKEHGSLLEHLHLFAAYLLIVIAIAACVLFALNVWGFFDFHIQTLNLILLVAGYLLFNTAHMTLAPALNFLGKRWWYVSLNNMALLCGLAFSVSLVDFRSATAESWLSGQIISWLAVSLIAYWALKNSLPPRRLDQKISGNFMSGGIFSSELFHFSWPLSITVALYWFQIHGYRFLLSHLGDVASVGLFVTDFGVGVAIVAGIDSILSQFYMPVFYNAIANSDAEKQSEAWNRYADFYCPSAVLLGAFAAAIGPVLALWLTGPQFHVAVWLATWGAMSESARMINSTYGLVAHARIKMRPTIIPSLTGAVSAFALIAILSRWNLFLGTGIALFAGMSLGTIHLAYNMHSLLPVRFPLKRCLKAGFYSLPFALIPLLSRVAFPGPFLVKTIAILIVFSGYALLAGWSLAKPCLAK